MKSRPTSAFLWTHENAGDFGCHHRPFGQVQDMHRMRIAFFTEYGSCEELRRSCSRRDAGRHEERGQHGRIDERIADQCGNQEPGVGADAECQKENDPATENAVIGVNDHTLVTEADGRRWVTREPAIVYFHKKYWFNIIAMIRDNGISYYCNLASPYILDQEALKYIDYDLDVKVFADGEKKLPIRYRFQ